jgi:hypothetical protein
MPIRKAQCGIIPIAFIGGLHANSPPADFTSQDETEKIDNDLGGGDD